MLRCLHVEQDSRFAVRSGVLRSVDRAEAYGAEIGANERSEPGDQRRDSARPLDFVVPSAEAKALVADNFWKIRRATGPLT